MASTTIGSDVRRPRRRSWRSWVAPDGLTKIAFALPLVFIFGYFSWWPIINGVALSVQRTNLVDSPEFVGWSNFPTSSPIRCCPRRR